MYKKYENNLENEAVSILGPFKQKKKKKKKKKKRINIYFLASPQFSKIKTASFVLSSEKLLRHVQLIRHTILTNRKLGNSLITQDDALNNENLCTHTIGLSKSVHTRTQRERVKIMHSPNRGRFGQFITDCAM